MLTKLNNNIFYLQADTGSAYENGKLHGEACKVILQKGITAFDEYLKSGFSIDLETFSKQFLDGASYMEDAKRLLPEVFEEFQGIACGADVPERILFTYSAIDETFEFLMQNFSGNEGVNLPEHCTSLGFKSAHNIPGVVAHNNDLDDYLDGTQLALDIGCTNGGRALTATFAGFLAQSGVNSHGLAVSVNTLMGMHSQRGGIVGTFTLRAILNQSSLSEAIALLERLPHASGVNYCLGDGIQSVCVECTPNEVCVISCSEGESFVTHTNHPLVNKDVDTDSESYRDIEEAKKHGAKSPITTLERFEKVTHSLKNHNGVMSADQVKELLCSEVIQNKELPTLVSMVAELTSPPKMWMAPRNAKPQDYECIQF